LESRHEDVFKQWIKTQRVKKTESNVHETQACEISPKRKEYECFIGIINHKGIKLSFVSSEDLKNEIDPDGTKHVYSTDDVSKCEDTSLKDLLDLFILKKEARILPAEKLTSDLLNRMLHFLFDSNEVKIFDRYLRYKRFPLLELAKQSNSLRKLIFCTGKIRKWIEGDAERMNDTTSYIDSIRSDLQNIALELYLAYWDKTHYRLILGNNFYFSIDHGPDEVYSELSFESVSGNSESRIRTFTVIFGRDDNALQTYRDRFSEYTKAII
jgi:hypothetical protein